VKRDQNIKLSTGNNPTVEVSVREQTFEETAVAHMARLGDLPAEGALPARSLDRTRSPSGDPPGDHDVFGRAREDDDRRRRRQSGRGAVARRDPPRK